MFAICPLVAVPMYAKAGVHHVISIGDADQAGRHHQPRPDISGWDHDFTLHRFSFVDVSHAAHPEAPNEAMVRRLLKVFDSIDANDNILFHCYAGVSRSTAAAFIWLVHRGMDYENAYQSIIAARGFAQPNLLMVKLADQILGHGGKMLRFVAAASGRPEYLTNPEIAEWLLTLPTNP